MIIFIVMTILYVLSFIGSIAGSIKMCRHERDDIGTAFLFSFVPFFNTILAMAFLCDEYSRRK